MAAVMTMIPATIPMTRNRFNLIPPFEAYYKLRATVFQVVYGCKYQERVLSLSAGCPERRFMDYQHRKMEFFKLAVLLAKDKAQSGEDWTRMIQENYDFLELEFKKLEKHLKDKTPPDDFPRFIAAD